jgi:hypothetical protein
MYARYLFATVFLVTNILSIKAETPQQPEDNDEDTVLNINIIVNGATVNSKISSQGNSTTTNKTTLQTQQEQFLQKAPQKPNPDPKTSTTPQQEPAQQPPSKNKVDNEAAHSAHVALATNIYLNSRFIPTTYYPAPW